MSFIKCKACFILCIFNNNCLLHFVMKSRSQHFNNWALKRPSNDVAPFSRCESVTWPVNHINRWNTEPVYGQCSLGAWEGRDRRHVCRSMTIDVTSTCHDVIWTADSSEWLSNQQTDGHRSTDRQWQILRDSLTDRQTDWRNCCKSWRSVTSPIGSLDSFKRCLKCFLFATYWHSAWAH